ncbi:MAG: minichromosome maintenance protein MCM [Candidatus Aenigmarchaeota archaeon]|nr:minichromosome maintenance protein MCM [Candidatus Aenigmarchaeota archaeon]
MPKNELANEELLAKFGKFIEKIYKKELIKASNEGEPLVIDFTELDAFDTHLSEMLLEKPEEFFGLAYESLGDMVTNPVKLKIRNVDRINIRDLRSKHIGKLICIEGIVRRASEVRPEIIETKWECSECGETFWHPRVTNIILKPLRCPNCKNKKDLKQIDKKMIDTRWITVEEPFELTEGDRPSQINVFLTEDLVTPEGRRLTDPGNRIKITGILKDIPKGKHYSVKLDFYLDANYVEPTESGWRHVEITPEDEKKIKEIAKDPNIYEKLIDSVAPSLYGMREIKEAVVLQMFGGVPRILKDGTKFRGDIHLLLIGDPSSGKSQLLKVVPQIVPRGKYVSGKGVTGAGLTATVVRDEQFMGGWVLEAGALVLTNGGLLAIDEFEKMSVEDQVAMHEALEQGTISIAKASIVATLPAQTSVLAGGNPKFSRFDPYMSLPKQITIPDTLLTRFDLKFILRDIPDIETDKKIVDHVLKTRERDFEQSGPVLSPEFIRKYVAYAKQNCKPVLTQEAAKILRKFYIDMRKKARESSGPIPITLRQFEALIRLSEASAKIQLSEKIRKEDAQRAIRLMTYSLMQLGLDASGQIDIDKAEGAAVTSSERSKIRTVFDIINELSQTQKMKEIPVDEIEKIAKKEGIENVSEILEKLKREGLLFEPSPGYVQKV